MLIRTTGETEPEGWRWLTSCQDSSLWLCRSVWTRPVSYGSALRRSTHHLCAMLFTHPTSWPAVRIFTALPTKHGLSWFWGTLHWEKMTDNRSTVYIIHPSSWSFICGWYAFSTCNLQYNRYQVSKWCIASHKIIPVWSCIIIQRPVPTLIHPRSGQTWLLYSEFKPLPLHVVTSIPIKLSLQFLNTWKLSGWNFLIFRLLCVLSASLSWIASLSYLHWIGLKIIFNI